MTLSAAHFVDSDITETASGSDSWTSTGQARTTAYPANRLHLEGETVQILDDGILASTQVITAGVLPSAIAGTYHIGLAYTSTLKPSKLDIEGFGLALTKKITKAIISFYNTVMGKYGVAATSLYTIPFSTTLFSGIKEVPLNSGYEREGDIVVVQDQPFPMVCRGLFLDAGVYEK